jgi:hypothetical protein
VLTVIEVQTGIEAGMWQVDRQEMVILGWKDEQRDWPPHTGWMDLEKRRLVND